MQFAADACPKGAVYGHVVARTPLLDEPLTGPVYLRSSDNELPDLVFDLHGRVDVEAVARIDSARGGIRATVEGIPDAPISRVVLRMQGGRKGLIVNSRDIGRCGRAAAGGRLRRGLPPGARTDWPGTRTRPRHVIIVAGERQRFDRQRWQPRASRPPEHGGSWAPAVELDDRLTGATARFEAGASGQLRSRPARAAVGHRVGPRRMAEGCWKAPARAAPRAPIGTRANTSHGALRGKRQNAATPMVYIASICSALLDCQPPRR